jgi:hypothetical protein
MFARGLEADAIATALIENLNCLQGKLPQHAMRNDTWLSPTRYAIGCYIERRESWDEK